MERHDQMISTIYFVLGIFLLLAARAPREHRSLILFTGWSSIAHDGVMIVQGLQHHDLRGDIVGFSIAMVLAILLLVFAPARQPRSLSATASG